MSPITITFSTPTVPGFQWIDSFENLEDEAIEEILLHCRYATVAFEAELLHRHKPIVDLAFDDYCDLIGEQANKIRTSELTATNIKSLCDELDSFLSKDKREHHTLKPAQQYLEFISRVLGRSYALLIFCALGKTVQRLSQVQRAKLMKHMSTHRKVLFCDALEGEALHTRQQRMHLPLYINISTRLNLRQFATSSSASKTPRHPLLVAICRSEVLVLGIIW